MAVQNSPDPFRGIAIFMQVVEAGSFTLAAQRLEMTKSGVAKSISRLESTLGVRLFNRTTRRLNLTDEGKVYREGCSRAWAELAAVQTQLNAHQQEPIGKLRVSLPVVFGRRWVLPTLLDLAATYPALELDISLTDRISDLIEERFDVAIRIGALQDSATLVARSLGLQGAVLCAHPDYLKQHGVPRTLDELSQHQCLTVGSGNQAQPWYFLDEHGQRLPVYASGRIAINHAAGLLDAALDARGIALLSDWLVIDALRENRLVEVLANVPKEGFPISAVWPKNKHLSPKVRVLVDTLAAQFSPHPPWEWASASAAAPALKRAQRSRSKALTSPARSA